MKSICISTSIRNFLEYLLETTISWFRKEQLLSKTCKELVNTCLYLILTFSSPGADGSWVYEDPAIEVKDGDTVYYWILIMVNGGGYQVRSLERSFSHLKSFSTNRKLTYPLFFTMVNQQHLQLLRQQLKPLLPVQPHLLPQPFQQPLLSLYQNQCLNWWNQKD